MANEMILNTRIQLKYDTWSNWSNDAVAGKGANLILKKGELGICEIPASTNAGQSTSEPVVLFKVGTYDGVNENTKKAFKDLPWISALAADVYGWAKKPTLDANDLPTIPVAKLPAIPGDKLGITVSVTGDGDAIVDASWDPTTKTLTLTKGETFVTKEEFDEHKEEFDAHTHQITATDDDIIIATGGELSVDVKHKKELGEGKSYTTGESTGTTDFGTPATLKIPALTVNEYGHITAVEDKEVTISIPTPEKVTLPTVDDKEVAGQVVVEVDQTNGAIDVKRKAIEIKHEGGQIYLTIDGTKIGTGFSDADFVKDGFLSKVDKDVDTNEIIFTWNTDAGLTETRIDIDDLVEVYDGDEETIHKDGFTFSVKDGGVGTAQIADKAVTKAKLEESVQASLAKADTALQSHQDISGKADKVADFTAGNFAGLDKNGNLTDSRKKASDFATAAQGAKADTAIQYIYGDTPIIAFTPTENDNTSWAISIKDNGIGARYLKSERSYTGADAEVWVFDCGDSTNV